MPREEMSSKIISEEKAAEFSLCLDCSLSQESVSSDSGTVGAIRITNCFTTIGDQQEGCMLGVSLEAYMRRCLMFPLFLCLWPGLALGQTQSASTKDKAASAHESPALAKVLSVGKDNVSVKGLWRPDNPTKKNELMEAVTELSCFRNDGHSLVGTEAFCLQVTAMVLDKTNGMLDVSTEWLKVIEWNEAQIIATDDSSICLTSQTILDLKRKTVLALDVRKPEAQGLRGACNLIPDRQTYYLQDVADYYGRKWAAR